MSKRKTTIIGTRVASEEFGVTSIVSSGGDRMVHRKEPCEDCPWRRDAPIGAFPAEAFRISADTAHDLSNKTFGCHRSTTEKPATCAGFLLRGADHNLKIRMAMITGRYSPDDVSSQVPLYENYREMAIANAVDEDDPELSLCRD